MPKQNDANTGQLKQRVRDESERQKEKARMKGDTNAGNNTITAVMKVQNTLLRKKCVFGTKQRAPRHCEEPRKKEKREREREKEKT